MGLLNSDEDTNAAISNGLLNFVAMAGKKKPFMGLLAGLQGYEQTQASARDRALKIAMEERKMKLEEEFKRAQIGEYQAQAQQRLAEIRAGEAKAAQEQGFLRDLLPRRIGAAEALAGGGGPTVANASRMGQVVWPDLAELALRYPARAKQLEELAGRGNWGRPEVARTIDGKDDNGLPATLQFDKFGGKVGSPTQQWKAPVEVNQGDRRTFIDPTTMQPLGGFGVNQSPDSKAGNAVAMRGQNMTDARARDFNSITAQGNTVKTETELRKEFADLPEVKTYKSALPSYNAVVDASKRGNPQADINLIYGLAKLYDPTSVVREGEYATIANSQAIPEWLKGQAQRLAGGGRLTPETKAQVVVEANSRIGAYQSEYEGAKNAFDGIASGRGAESKNVFTPVGTSRAKTVVRTGTKDGRKWVRYSDGSEGYGE